MNRGELAPLRSRPQDMRILELLMAAVWGFLIGGLFADKFVYSLQVIGAGVALGTYVATIFWLLRFRDRDLALTVAIGSAVGAVAGLGVLGLDALVA